MQVLRLITMPQAFPSPSSCCSCGAGSSIRLSAVAAVRARASWAKSGFLRYVSRFADPDQVAAFHAEVVLHGRQPAALARLADLEARPRTRARPRSADR